MWGTVIKLCERGENGWRAICRDEKMGAGREGLVKSLLAYR